MSKHLSYPYCWQPPFRPNPVSQHSGGDADNALYLKKFFWARTIEGIWRSEEPFLSKRNSGRYLYQIAEGSKKAIERKAEPEKVNTSRHQGFGGCLRGNASAPTWERLQDKWEAVGWECSCPSWTPRARGLFPKPSWFSWNLGLLNFLWTFLRINPVYSGRLSSPRAQN